MSKRKKRLTTMVLAGALLIALTMMGSVPASAQTEDKDLSLILVADTVRGNLNLLEGDMGANLCVQRSRFSLGEHIVWRIRVYDPQLGTAMDDVALDSVQVLFDDGQLFETRYAGHGAEGAKDFFWTTSWVIPEDYPTGSLGHQIIAKAKDGRTGEFVPFNVSYSLLTIVLPQ
ncbi:MAG: hypothetical protein V3U04_06980 [Candidatus Aerophobetes bacterium]